MRDYLLFIDTESSGLPLKWNEPYSKKGNWPYAVQVAWIIYTKEGQEIKTEDHYILNNDFEITPEAIEIHGITPAYLQENGKNRKTVLDILYHDLQQYQPLVIGHFMQLDYHLLGAEFYRIGMDNPLEQLPSFCTMLASANYSRNPRQKYLRLGNLYKTLFGQDMKLQHNALVDAKATAAAFFQMQKLGDVNNTVIARQQSLNYEFASTHQKSGCGFSFLIFFFSSLLISYLL